jgi:hypothetical protein
LVLLAVAPLCVGFLLYLEKQSVNLLLEQFHAGKTKIKTAVDRKDRKERFLQKHTHSDPYFLNKKVENLSFLESEKSVLKQWINHPGISNKEPLVQRLHFLASGENRLAFTEEEIQLSKLYKETKEKQKSPIEVDEQDLKGLLGLIEEVHPGTQESRPQLIVSECSLHKKQTSLQREVLEVKMDLFKREFLAP